MNKEYSNKYINKYVTDNHIKLSQNQIKILFEDRFKNNDSIVKSQLPICLKYAIKYSYKSKFTPEDLFSISLLALQKAVNGYDTTSEASFTTYCKNYINYDLMNYLNNPDTSIIKQPQKQKNMNTKGLIIPQAYSFSNWIDDNGNYSIDFENNYSFETDINIQKDNEDKLIELIRNNLKKEMWSDIVINKLGLGMVKRLNNREHSKLLDINEKQYSTIYKQSIERLKQNKGFKIALNQIINKKQM
ncbi:hypothetical protein [Corallibacter sp.]|uniref:hypothetical protein n=1 Tax=Corallibacter sp. TaxID=2038084 RepID=UPI003AB6C1E5